MKRKPIHIGIIGLGRIGKTHAEAYRQISEQFAETPFTPVIKALLRSHAGGDEDTLQKIGSPAVYTNPDEFFSQALDMVDICTPNFLHLGQAEQAFARGMHVYCEKPLGLNLDETARMAKLAAQAGVLTHTAFIFRYLPAFKKAAELVKGGAIGRPNHFRFTNFHGSYLDVNRPGTWRMKLAESGGGALADLGIHLIDSVHDMLGDVAWVQCNTQTVIGERPQEGGSTRMIKVDVDDWALCTLGLGSGALGTLEASRISGGRPLDSTGEIYGSSGSLEASYEDCRQVRLFSQKSGKWQTLDGIEQGDNLLLKPEWLKCRNFQEYFMTAHMASIYDFLGCILEGKPSSIDFGVGLQAQEVLEASYASAAHGGVRIDLPSCLAL